MSVVKATRLLEAAVQQGVKTKCVCGVCQPAEGVTWGESFFFQDGSVSSIVEDDEYKHR